MLRRAREADLGTVVVGDWDRALGRHADLWVPWNAVENGEVELVPKRKKRREHGFQNDDDDDHDRGDWGGLNEDEELGQEFRLLHSEDEDEDVGNYYYYDDDDDDEEEEEEEDGLYIF